jgi:hypothetical protein
MITKKELSELKKHCEENPINTIYLVKDGKLIHSSFDAQVKDIAKGEFVYGDRYNFSINCIKYEQIDTIKIIPHALEIFFEIITFKGDENAS